MKRFKYLLLLALLAASTMAFGGNQFWKRYRLIYFDGHMHTVESDGSGTVEDIKTVAQNRGLNAVIVTNHTKQLSLAEWNNLNRRTRALSDRNFLMLNSFEVTGSEGLLNRDHILAWGVRDPFVGINALEQAPEEVWPSPPNPNGTGASDPDAIARWIHYIHANGGIAVHAHTTGTTNPAYGVDFIELFNLSHVKDVASYALQLGFSPADAWNLGLLLNNRAIYGEEGYQDMEVTIPGMGTLPLKAALYQATLMLTGHGEVVGAPEAPLRSWDELLMAYVNSEIDRPVFGAANSDAHNTYNVPGRSFSGVYGDTRGDRSQDDSDVGEAKNGVLVEDLTREDLLDAIRAGRCFATTGPSLRFTVNRKEMGETVRFWPYWPRKATISLSAYSENYATILAKINIIKNGQVWKTYTPGKPVFRLDIADANPTDGYYRVEVIAFNAATNAYSFAYANPIFTRDLTDFDDFDEDDAGVKN